MRICFCLIICLFLPVTVHAACSPSIPASTPDSQLLDNGNGTITDLKTGLMWKKCMEGVVGDGCDTGAASSFTWEQALAQPDMINTGEGFAGYYDWRLPNIKELTSIVEEQCYNPAINLNRFPHASGSYVCSGTPSAYYSNSAWYVQFYTGRSSSYGRFTGFQVRLVRAGQ